MRSRKATSQPYDRLFAPLQDVGEAVDSETQFSFDGTKIRSRAESTTGRSSGSANTLVSTPIPKMVQNDSRKRPKAIEKYENYTANRR
jgi:hypothetical protein